MASVPPAKAGSPEKEPSSSPHGTPTSTAAGSPSYWLPSFWDSSRSRYQFWHKRNPGPPKSSRPIEPPDRRGGEKSSPEDKKP